MGSVPQRDRGLHIRFAAVAVEVDVHHVDPVVVGIGGSIGPNCIAVDRDPFLVRFLARAGVGREDIVGVTVVSGDPRARSACSTRADRDRDRLVWNRRVGLVADLVFLVARAVVEELIWKERLVIVAVGVEGAHRIGIVGETFITRNVPHRRPGLTTVEGLVETNQVVVALGAGEPLGRSDEMVWIRRIHPDIRFGVVSGKLWFGRRITRLAAGLRGIGDGADVFVGPRAGA